MKSATTAGRVSPALNSRLILTCGGQIYLTDLEYRLLVILARRPGTVITLEELGIEASVTPSSVTLHAGLLQRKLDHDQSLKGLIREVPGFGYRFLGGFLPSGS